MKDIGIEKNNHQYVIVQHKDKEHDHYHIVANRVGMDGELLNDHRIKDRLQVACDKAEQEQGLRRTQAELFYMILHKKKALDMLQTKKRKIIKHLNQEVRKRELQIKIQQFIMKNSPYSYRLTLF
ncbi:relaxase/mobilization nuclease domain-containing protein [Sphingobacterium sp. IITKGP-BTPF85]|uniref:relaxase/mobilization nuclease domain-containing protein n=1 Tax=Sphingobacterium sp. IITKGP-BTPF85 TaxID=1338009 RepID=UPI000389E714|nr:relaxase/mobilization nuclease domain-containing protein [Sphingobacterium sp. IITKGP-BTPF85]KKX46491.1 hypothetical protein L950_0231660 [Sphingobacterium sp. IITKGP-BTPF85]